MRRLLPILAVTLFALFAAQPLAVDQLTCSDDSAFHIGRAVNLEKLIDTGHWFPRWSPYMAQGYGYPFFNYYAPLSSYVLVALHKLGFIYPVALHLAFFFSLWFAGLATYAFTRDWWGEAGGVVAAVVYLSAPYFAYDILFRGNLAESFALIFPPLILFTLHRAINPEVRSQEAEARQSETKAVRLRIGSWDLGIWDFGILRFGILNFGFWDFAASASFAALLLTHNATALLATPLFIGYIFLLAFLHKNWRSLIRGSLILFFGLALSAYFWLPALLETNLVQTDKLLVPPIFTYYTNYLSLSELFAPPAVIDPLIINPSPAKALGLVATLLAIAGFLTIAVRSSQSSPKSSSFIIHHSSFLFPPSSFLVWLLSFGILYSSLTLAISQPIWDSLPLIKFIQFPWRFLSLAMLCAAILAGASVRWPPTRQWEIATALVLVAALGQLSWWYPRYCVPFQETTLATTLQYERDTATLGTTAKGEYLPRTTQLLPADPTLAQTLIRGDQPQYLTGLPADSNFIITQTDPLNYQATLTLPRDSTLTFNQFFFPGWAATVDNQTLTLSPAPETGLITFSLPAGTHTLNIYFANTPLRLTASFISIIALTFFILHYSLFIVHLPFPPLTPILPLTHTPIQILLIPIILLFARPLLIDRTFNPLRHSAFDRQTINIGQPLNLNLASGLTILSFETPTTVASGSDFDVSLYLTARDPIANAYRPRFDLSDPARFIWNNGNEALPPRWHKEPPETNLWPLDQYAQWSRRQTVLPGTPPGDYNLTVTIFDRATLAPDSVMDENGNAVSPVTPLRTIHLTRPSTPPRVTDLNIQYPADHNFGPLTLIGYNLDRAQAQPGDRVFLTFFFRADERMPIGHHFNLLIDPSYPTNEWQPGDIWRFQVFGRIPPESNTGPFQFKLTPLTLATEPFFLAPIQIIAPNRIFTRPEIATPTSIKFKNAIELAGYDIQTTNNQLQITLLWQALTSLDTDLIAFLHIEDASGRIVAQSDAVPANWSRPTLGWAPGEYILDPRSLPALPPGDYTLYLGLADRLSGTRFGDRTEIGVYKAP